jgi:hypothetical protein
MVKAMLSLVLRTKEVFQRSLLPMEPSVSLLLPIQSFLDQREFALTPFLFSV